MLISLTRWNKRRGVLMGRKRWEEEEEEGGFNESRHRRCLFGRRMRPIIEDAWITIK